MIFASKSYIKYILVLCLVVAFPSMASQDEFIDGLDYVKLPQRYRNNPNAAQFIEKDPGKVQVLFFFSYGCPACANFDPAFQNWESSQNKGKTSIYGMPVSFEEEWTTLAKLYFVMKTIAPKQNFDAKIFAAIHQQNMKLWQEPIMKQYIVKNGYSEKTFEQTYNSALIESKVEQAEALSKDYKVAQTPTIIVNGANNSYRINLDMVDNNDQKFFEVLNYLVVKG